MLDGWETSGETGKPSLVDTRRVAALRSIAVRRPGSTAALLEVKGVGPAFVERHADSLFVVLQAAA